MTRRLNLQSPLVFEPFAPKFVRRLVFLLIIAPGVFFGNLAMSTFSGALLVISLVVIVILSIAFCLFVLDGIEGIVIVDADGIEWRSPIKKKRLLWNDGLNFQVREMYSRGGTIRVFDVSSAEETISFGENLRNLEYLKALIDAGIHGRADKNSQVSLPPPFIDSASKSQTVNTLLLVAVLSFFGSVLAGILLIGEARILFFTPSAHIKDVAMYADKYTDIRIKGKLHLEPPLVSRDKKHSLAYQYLQLDDPTHTVTAIMNPPSIEIVEGSDKLTIQVPNFPPGYFGMPTKTTFEKDWQNSDTGKMVAVDVDDILKEYESVLPQKDHQLSLWSIEQDRPVEVVGHIKTENGQLFLKPKEGNLFWMMPSPNKQLEQEFLFKAVVMGATLALSMFMLTSAYFELKRE